MSLRAGLVGGGAFATLLADAARNLPAVELAAVAAPNTAEDFARRHHVPHVSKDYRTLLETAPVDAIAIAAPTDVHLDIAMAAADAAAHLVCPPPLASTFAEAELMLHAVRRAGTTLLYADPVLFSPSSARLLDLVTTGLIGEPDAVRVRVARPLARDGWAADSERAGGGAIMQLAAGGILFAARAFRAWPVSALAHASADDGGFDTSAVIVLDFGGGRRALIDVDGGSPALLDTIEVKGPGGCLTADRVAGTLEAAYVRRGARDGHANAESHQHWPVDSVRDSGAAQVWQHLADVLAGRARLAAGLEDGLNVLEVIYAAYGAAATGQRTLVEHPADGEFAPALQLAPRGDWAL